MTDVMISYSRRDGDFVRRLHAGLQERGRDVWVDWQDIPLSADWWQEIANAIEAADTFVFVVSPDSMGSPICNLEMAHARHNNKRLIPILYRRTDLDDALDVLNERVLSENTEKILNDETIEEIARQNWNAVSRHNWLYFEDINNFDESLDRLLKVIETDLAHVKEHTRLLVRASEWDRRERKKGFLLTGEEISEAENWLAIGMNKDPKPTTLHADYVGASRRLAQARQRRLLVGVSAALVVAVILTILSVVLAVYAQNQQSLAVAAQNEAEAQAQIAATSAAEANSLLWASYADQTLAEGDSPLSLSLALASVGLETPPALAYATLSRVAFSPGPIARYQPEPITERTDITDVRFNLTGTQAAVGMADGRVILYDLPTETVDHVFDDFSASVTSLTFSPDGSQLLVSSFNIVTVLDMQTYEVLQTLEHPLGTIVNAVAISPQGTEAVTGSNNSALLHWDLATGEVLQELRGHAGEVTSVAFGPVTGRVLSGALDNRMILWDLNAGESLRVYEHASSVTSVAFSPVGNTVASGTQLGVLTVRNLETGEIVRTLGGDVVQHGTQPITKLAYGADGRVLVSGGEDQLAIVWSTFTGTPLYVFDTHNGAISGVDIDPNGRTVLTGSEDGSLFWWSIADDSVSQRFTQNGHNEQLEAMAYSPDGSLLVTSDLNGVLLLWDTQTAEVIGRYNNAVGSHLDAVKDLAFLPDGSQFVTASEDMTVGIWDVADDDRIVMKLEGAHTNGLHAVAVAPDGDLLLTGDGNGRVVLWDLTTGEVRQTLSDGASDTGHTRDVMSLTFNADGSLALSGSVDRRMILWDVASGEPLQTYSHGGRILGVGFSADETRVYSGGNDDTLAVWDRASGTEIERISIGQDGQERYTSTVTFHQANEFALVGRVDGSAVLIDLVPLRTIARYEANASVGNANQITSAAFRPDGLAASIGARNRVVLELRTLTLPELIEWTRANRYIPDLPCRERQTFNIPCEGDAQIEIDTTSEPAS